MVLKRNKRIFLPLLLLFSLMGVAQNNYEYDETDDIVLETEEMAEIDTLLYFMPGDQHDQNGKPFVSSFDSLKWQRLAERMSFDEVTEDSSEKNLQAHQKKEKKPGFNFSKMLPYLWLIPVLLIIVLVLWRLFPNLNRNKKNIREPLHFKTDNLEEEEIRELEIENALVSALNEENYQLAYRLKYLATLKELIENNLIFYRKEKTNFEYLLQLIGKTVHESFRLLTLNFDGIWYGDSEINKETYLRLEKHFEEFNSALKNYDKK